MLAFACWFGRGLAGSTSDLRYSRELVPCDAAHFSTVRAARGAWCFLSPDEARNFLRSVVARAPQRPCLLPDSQRAGQMKYHCWRER